MSKDNLERQGSFGLKSRRKKIHAANDRLTIHSQPGRIITLSPSLPFNALLSIWQLNSAITLLHIEFKSNKTIAMHIKF
jgi:hypothetical protein